jgi:hypothetical protein
LLEIDCIAFFFSSLRELIEKPPIMGSIKTLTADQIAGFKLAPGQVSINSRLFDLTEGLNATQLNPPESIREDGGKRYKRSLDDFEGMYDAFVLSYKEAILEIERRVKKHKMDEREKEKKKKKKKDKEKRKVINKQGKNCISNPIYFRRMKVERNLIGRKAMVTKIKKYSDWTLETGLSKIKMR